ncbi:unnamed protein product [Rhodiola kirilowii]
MSPATITAAILLAVISNQLTSSSSHLTHVHVGSQCDEIDSICQVNEMKLKVARLETMLEERSESLKSRSLLREELDRRNDELTTEILKLESHVEQLKGVEMMPGDEAVSSLEDEVQSLWSLSRKNNFDLHILESKAVEAEERLEDVKSEVEKMADIVTEQWIQFRHLEQALLGVQIKTVDTARQICLQKCSFFERMPLLLDQHLSQNMPAIKLYWSKVLHQVNMLLSAVKKYHLQLQDFVRQEMEKTQLTAFYTSEELVFFLSYPLKCSSTSLKQACLNPAAVDPISCSHDFPGNFTNYKILHDRISGLDWVFLYNAGWIFAKQVIEMSRGWPLGLEIMHIRLRQTQPVLEPMPSTSSFLHLPSASLSSASSSSSEKKSTSSFFDDGSVTLGRLVGIRARLAGLRKITTPPLLIITTVIMGLNVMAAVRGGKCKRNRSVAACSAAAVTPTSPVCKDSIFPAAGVEPAGRSFFHKTQPSGLYNGVYSEGGNKGKQPLLT